MFCRRLNRMTYLLPSQTQNKLKMLRKLLSGTALAGALFFAGAYIAVAQDDGAEPTAAAAEEAAPVATQDTAVDATSTGSTTGAAAGAAVTANDVNDVARELWCPLCSGVRLDACELKACDQMKDVIGQKLGEGEDVTSIKNYFVAQYGPQVLGEPPMEGFNWLAWILPVVAIIAGGLFVWSRVRNSTRQAQNATGTSAPAVAAGDPYSQKLEEELKYYD
jgi:cytochrome c-type biogenesis protein CcmH